MSSPDEVRDGPELQALIRSEVRGYIAGLAQRYVPLFAGVLAFILLIVIVPDGTRVTTVADGLEQTLSTTGGPSLGNTSGHVVSGGTGVPISAGVASTPGALPSTSVAGRLGTDAAAPGFATPGSPQTTTVGPAGKAGTSTAQSGVAGNGTRCGPGVRQFSFTPYAPLCAPKFTGSNGGSTSHGVTPTTITAVIRSTNDADTLSAAGGTPSTAQITRDYQVLANYFNAQFELYGRKVVLKSFTGRGSFVQEAGGQDQSGANTDAQTAYDMDAFADPSGFVLGTYADALASHKIVHFSLIQDRRTLTANYPYRFAPDWPVEDDFGQGIGDLVCQRMARLPAAFAGDSTTRGAGRTFAIVGPESATIAPAMQATVARAKKMCGVTIEMLTYPTDVSQYPTSATQIAARLKSDGVTTVISQADPIYMQFLTQSATRASYYPEWLALNEAPTASPRTWDANQLPSMLFSVFWGLHNQQAAETNCYKIYRLADPSGQPQSGNFLPQVCSELLSFYGALQAAGPNLTPATFAEGWFARPPTSAGEFGPWASGRGAFSPLGSYVLATWNNSATNAYDGKAGALVACGERRFSFLNGNLGSGQLRCHKY